MNEIFKGIPLPEKENPIEYYCARGADMLIYDNCTKEDYEKECAEAVKCGYSLFDTVDIKSNYHRTFFKDKMLHIYFCENEKKLQERYRHLLVYMF